LPLYIFNVTYIFAERHYEIDSGIYINTSVEIIKQYENIWDLPWDIVVEKMFSAKPSENKIYYEGADYRGSGKFWIEKDGTKRIILEEYIRYGPQIVWHSQNIAEIFIPTGSPFNHSYIFDFDTNTLSEGYPFVMYVDIDRNYVMFWEDDNIHVFNFRNNNEIKKYNFRADTGIYSLWPYFDYNFILEKNHIKIEYYDVYENKNGIVEYDYK
jgi:hypothetical protein